jgi:hypothetical protein
MPEANGTDEELKILEHAYERVLRERERLRDARGFFARPLGPAPASAGISTALVTTLSSSLDTVFFVLALVSLGLLVITGMLYDGKPAYRHLYARELTGTRERPNTTPVQPGLTEPQQPRTLAEWLGTMLEREEHILGYPDPDNDWRSPWATVATLQQGVDSERTGLRLVQGLWLAVIVFLVFAAT